ncbi:GrpE-domain-containing protein [Myriangium duriaei CBS 260.36]|uniref:GrpE protein homolog n=1 Tax=Myriangium duriaei CBS 260.36 TaxID=1168546 RepID=A0A9P4J6I5_9PEZI|nr:GrpE-domain-containing protein [Myriangium duriaei CBS 260.36]
MSPSNILRQSLARAARTSAFSAVETRTPLTSRLGQPHGSVSSSAVRHFSGSRRCFAEAEAAKDAQKENGEAKAEGAQQDATAKELEAKKKEVLDVTDKWKRSIADYRNLQEQTKREVTAAREFAIQRFAKDLIDSVDNFDRALETVPKEKLTEENKDLKSLYDGLRMTETILMSTLKKHGLERVDPSEKGEKFDPNKHEATFMVPQPDKEDGSCFHTQQKGFSLNGRVLRAAKVGVVKNS